MFMVLSSWSKIARVHPVHLMNVDWAPGGRQPSDKAGRLRLWVRRKLAATVHIHHVLYRKELVSCKAGESDKLLRIGSPHVVKPTPADDGGARLVEILCRKICTREATVCVERRKEPVV